MKNIYLFCLLMCTAVSGWADYQLDSQLSSLTVVSIKANTVGETHRFAAINGAINAAGQVQVLIDLASIDTGIEVRDQRMRDYLFEVANFSRAQLTATVNPHVIEVLLAGKRVAMDVPARLSLHGVNKTLDIPVVAMADDRGRLVITSATPVLLNAVEFGLLPGLDKLQELAGLSAIAAIVPVSFSLVFNPV